MSPGALKLLDILRGEALEQLAARGVSREQVKVGIAGALVACAVKGIPISLGGLTIATDDALGLLADSIVEYQAARPKKVKRLAKKTRKR